jgi:hypothetical protein
MMEGSRSIQIMKDPDPGGPKTYGSYGSGSTTLVQYENSGFTGKFYNYFSGRGCFLI